MGHYNLVLYLIPQLERVVLVNGEAQTACSLVKDMNIYAYNMKEEFDWINVNKLKLLKKARRLSLGF